MVKGQDFHVVLRGIEQFNQGKFFECHDTIESVWLETRGPERLLYQGLIQVAVGYYHASHGNFSAAASQFTKAVAKLTQFPDSHMDLDLKSLIKTVRLHRAVYTDVVRRKYNPLSAKQLPAPKIIVH